VQGAQEETPPPAPPGDETGNKTERINLLRAELESTNSELKAAEEEEERVIKQVNDRKGMRLTYNTMQLRQLEADLAPLQQELADLQVKKGGLIQRKASIEGELRSLGQ
jgi:septal ring factor EnvC (AmiA/AmiB activator)